MMMLTPGRTRRPAEQLDLHRDRAGTFVLTRRGLPVAYFSHESEARQALESLKPRAHDPLTRPDLFPDED